MKRSTASSAADIARLAMSATEPALMAEPR